MLPGVGRAGARRTHWRVAWELEKRNSQIRHDASQNSPGVIVPSADGKRPICPHDRCILGSYCVSGTMPGAKGSEVNRRI